MTRSGWPIPLVRAVREFVESDSWAAARVVVEHEPRLLTDAADGVLADLIAQAVRHDDESARHSFGEHRDLLARIRTDGLRRIDELIGDGIPEPLRVAWIDAELTHERFRRQPVRARMDAALRDADAVLLDPALGTVAADRRMGLLRATAGVAMARYLAADDESDLDRAVQLYRLAWDALPAQDPDRSAIAAALGSALCMRFERRGGPEDSRDSEDLDAGIAWARRAVPGVPEADRWLVHHNLAANLGVRYELLGEPADLTEALEAMRESLAADPPPAQAVRVVSTLASLLVDRFERDGALEDLDSAAELVGAVLPAAASAEERAQLRVNSATIAQLRFPLDGELAQLDTAVADLRRATREFGRGSAHRPLCSQLLGSLLLTRWEAAGDPADLDAALDALRRALDAVPATNPRAALFGTLLGLAEVRAAVAGRVPRARFGRAPRDPLSAAVERLRHSAAAAERTPRLLPFALINFGTAVSARHLRDRRDVDLEAGASAYRTAIVRAASEDPQLALRGAVEWGDWAVARAGWIDADSAYRAAIDAIDQLRRHQLVSGHKRVWIALGGGLAEKAATAAVRARRPRHAAVHLERCRAQLLGETLSVTGLDLSRLDRVAPDLAARYRSAAERVRALEARTPYADSRMGWPGRAQTVVQGPL